MRYAPRGSGRWGLTGPGHAPHGCALGIGGPALAAQLVGSDHEPSHCLGGMWLYPCRVFCLLAEHGLLQVLTGDRNPADRVRAAGRGCQDLARPDLPHAVRADRAGGGEMSVDLRTRRLPAADGVAAPGARRIAARSCRPIRSTWSCRRCLRRTPAKKRKRVAGKKKPTTVAAQPAAGSLGRPRPRHFLLRPRQPRKRQRRPQYPWPTR